MQVVEHHAGFINLEFEFKVDDGQLLVDRLQFFLAGFQLLGSRTELFIDSLLLLAESLELFIRCLGLLDGLLKIFFELPDLGFQLVNQRLVRLAGTARRQGQWFFRHLFKHHQHQRQRHFGLHFAKEMHAHFDQDRAVAALDRNGMRPDRLASMQGLVKRRTQFGAQLGLHVVEQIDRRRATARQQKFANILGQVQDVVLAVDQHTGQGHLVDQLVMQFRKRNRLGSTPVGAALAIHQASAGLVFCQQQMADGIAIRVDLEEAVFFIKHGEKLMRRLDRFRTAQKQKSIRHKRKPEGSQNTGLRRLVQVNQKVAAANQVDAGKRRVAQHVVVGKQNLFPQLLV